jgi:serine/threonine protein kinase
MLEKNLIKSQVGTILYMSPEVYYGSGYDTPCDIWSIGMIILEILLEIENNNETKVLENLEEIRNNLILDNKNKNIRLLLYYKFKDKVIFNIKLYRMIQMFTKSFYLCFMNVYIMTQNKDQRVPRLSTF